MTGVAISLGDVIGGRYAIEAVLGQGGMAIVYKARHTGTGKACALKVVHPHLVARPELVEMFIREARISGHIGDNPHIVNVFDTAVDEALKVPFVVMELIEGETLEKLLEARAPMGWPLVRVIFEQLADALEQAHRAGVIHRDLKPGNLILTKDRKGQPVLKVMDFGIAKILEHGVQGTITHIGSPIYAAPEQQAGDSFRRLAARENLVIAQEVSPATDVWPLALIAYELLTGLGKGQVWGFSTASDLVVKVVLEAAPVPSVRAGERASVLPPGFDAWFARCLRKNAAERWPTARQAAEELIRLIDFAQGMGAAAPAYGQPVAPVSGSQPLAFHAPGAPPSAPMSATPGSAPAHSSQPLPHASQPLPHSHSLPHSQPLPHSHSLPHSQPLPHTQPLPHSSQPLPHSSQRLSTINPQDPTQSAGGTGGTFAVTAPNQRRSRTIALVCGAAAVCAALILLVLLVSGRGEPDTPAAGAPGQTSSALPTAAPSALAEAAQAASAEPGAQGEIGGSAAADEPEDAPIEEAEPQSPGAGATPTGAYLYVASEGRLKQCSVSVNGKRVGRTPIISKRVEAGKITIRCTAKNVSQEKTIEVPRGKHERVVFTW
jgi:serine/threonine-protein kinase